MFQQLKKKKTSLNKMAYTRKPIKINEIHGKKCLGGVWQSNYINLISFVLNIFTHLCV